MAPINPKEAMMAISTAQIATTQQQQSTPPSTQIANDEPIAARIWHATTELVSAKVMANASRLIFQKGYMPKIAYTGTRTYEGVDVHVWSMPPEEFTGRDVCNAGQPYELEITTNLGYVRCGCPAGATQERNGDTFSYCCKHIAVIAARAGLPMFPEPEAPAARRAPTRRQPDA